MQRVVRVFALAGAGHNINVVLAEEEREPIVVVKVRQVMDWGVEIAVVIEVPFGEVFDIVGAAGCNHSIEHVGPAEETVCCMESPKGSAACDYWDWATAITENKRDHLFD